MTDWMLATLSLLPSLIFPLFVAFQGRTGDRLIAIQLATAVTVLILVLMSFAFDQSSYIDLALTLVLLSLPGTLILAQFLERWL